MKKYPLTCFQFIGGLCLTLNVFAQTNFIGENPQIAAWKIGQKKEVVIVLHGGPCAEHTYLRPEFDYLKKWATVVYYDQRGCGKSESAKSYTWQEHVKDLQRIIRHFAGKQKVFLAGSSWGSALALLYAYEHPEDLKGLILSGLFKWEGRGREEGEAYFRRQRHRNIREYRNHLLKERQVQSFKDEDGKVVDKIVEIEKVASITSGPAHSHTRESLQTAPIFADLKKIEIPVIVFNGTYSCGFVEQVKAYRSFFTNGTYVEIKESCHDPWFANPDLFFQACGRFIKKNRRRH